jgi:hypothetical protein
VGLFIIIKHWPEILNVFDKTQPPHHHVPTSTGWMQHGQLFKSGLKPCSDVY